MTPRRIGTLKALLFALALLPALRLLAGAMLGRLGANPTEFISRNSGDWTLYFLCLALAVTPLRTLLHQPWLARLRRMLGLFCFFYACLHVAAFVWFDHFFDWMEIWKDVAKRPFVTVGFSTFMLLLPLAVTSTDGMQRRLGGKRWQRLHRLVYVAALTALLHFFWMKAGKHDFAQPLLFTALVGGLLAARVWRAFGGR